MRLPYVSCALLLVSCGTAEPEPAPIATSPTTLSTAAAEHAKAAASGPRIAVVSTVPGATQSTLRLQPVSAADPAPPTATLSHLPDGEVRGAFATATDAAYLVAETEAGRDRSFRSSLWRVRTGSEPQKLADGLVYASRPLVMTDGSVVVQRGVAGEPPSPEQIEAGQLRTDSLSVDLYDPAGQHQKALHTFNGYITHLAGHIGREVLLYRVSFQHADIVAVHADTGALRTVLPELPAMARDFSVDADGGHLVYANLDEKGWHVARLALSSGQVDVLERAIDMRVTPGVWPGGGVLVNDGRGGTLTTGSGPDRPLGDGFDEVRAAGGQWVALEHHVPSQLSVPFAYDRKTASVHRLALPSGARHSVLGVVP